MVNLIIKYYKLGNNRYLRALNVEGNEELFINNPLNLGFIKIKKKEDLNKDFEICIKRIGKEIKISRSYEDER